jgi:hypothetical protein
MIEELTEKELAFAEELGKYEDKWVAILRNGDEEIIVGSGGRIKDARREAEAKGFRDAVYFKVPPSHKVFIPCM